MEKVAPNSPIILSEKASESIELKEHGHDNAQLIYDRFFEKEKNQRREIAWKAVYYIFAAIGIATGLYVSWNFFQLQ